MRVPSELFRLQQRAGQVNQQAKRHEAGERIVEDHDPGLRSEPFAAVSVGNRNRKEAECETQHENVHHGILLLRLLVAMMTTGAFRKTARAPDQASGRLPNFRAEVPRRAYVFEAAATATL